ncbi:Sensor histidine kinase/response regulator Fos-1/TcsA [Penicillium digitatum]|uniref:Sensor histidine kinase/response regulator Fos-1/TcsA n=3 Tax=Penicillium digitatum TaxID=36651 RepID=K9FA89_PEND2|nr:Sensor histidine kinase/response regulator Fos-1/TcsA [Penicillium digitatum Pd1]EKV04932.1 Sensor histidine kinase/response regulator Fos-1/TcsA [Penicillium digitatum PHI26]EKV13758.1 Sensor histidine kinase/response regulator Fos-1/TcsA [Penicillium digitatum Pd1]QQK45122.1 Sensor histidine kinase/response regulator Fos-1/TcsA [Penicillium digitatum]
MPVDQMLHLSIDYPMNNVAMVITPPAEGDVNIESKDLKQPIASESLSRIYRFTPKPTLVLDGALRIVEVSNSHVEIFKCPRDQLLATNVYDLPLSILPAPDIASLSGALGTAISTREVQVIKRVHVELIDAFFSLNVTPIFEEDSLIYVLLEAQRTEHRPNRSNSMSEQTYLNETYKILVDTVRDYAIFMLDTRGHIGTWNSGAAILKGYTSSEIIGQHFSVFYGRADCEMKKPTRELEVCLQEGKVEDEGWRYRKDGTRFWANVMITAIYQNGSHVGFVKVTRDMTERRATEARLIDAFEESAKLKSDFLANMSHELRTPMNGMLLALTMLLRTELTDDQREFGCILEDSTSILLQVINDVLDYSKLSSGTFPLNPDVVNIPNVISAVVRNCQSALKPGVQIMGGVSEGFPSNLKGDPLRFRQVLQNMVTNAVKFTESGYVRVHAAYAIDEKDPDMYVISTQVVDTGIGVPEDATSTLFTPFTRFADTAAKRYQGTGLGLSICKSLAELMDGAVGFHANPDGPGSVFWMTAKMARLTSPVSPVKQSLRSGTPEALDNSASLQKIAPHKHILLVEDNKVNQLVMLKLLSNLGFKRVDAAWDGAEAVRMVKQKPLTYSVILMDISMPVMDGLTATEHIRRMKLDVPILALTGNALKGDAEAYLAKGMNDYIAKPLHRQQLVDLLWKWCGP